MELTYRQVGDYRLPNLTLPTSPKVELGPYAEMRRIFLREHRRVEYYNLLTSCELDLHLADTQSRALEMEEKLIRELSKNEGVTEKLKAENMIEWVRRMNSIRNRVQEIVRTEVIYS